MKRAAARHPAIGTRFDNAGDFNKAAEEAFIEELYFKPARESGQS